MVSVSQRACAEAYLLNVRNKLLHCACICCARCTLLPKLQPPCRAGGLGSSGCLYRGRALPLHNLHGGLQGG